MQRTVSGPRGASHRLDLVVLLTSAFDCVGGIHTFNRALVAALDELSQAAKLGVLVLSLLDGPPGPDAAKYMRSGCITFRGFSGRRAHFAGAALGAARSSKRVLFGHVNLVSLATLMPRRAHVMVMHGIEVWGHLSPFKIAGMARVRDVLSVSDFTQRTVAALNGTPPAKFHWFPNTLDPFYAESDGDLCNRQQLGLPKGPMMLSVTRLHEQEGYKRIDLALKAVACVLRRVPDAFYVIVGEGTLRPSLERMTAELGISERVVFTGAVSTRELKSYYRACDIFLLPSLKEGFGIVFLEAMHFCKACVGANATAVPEVIAAGETGLLVPPDDEGRLAAALEELLNDAALRERLGQCGKLRLETEFSFSAFRQRLQQALELY